MAQKLSNTWSKYLNIYYFIFFLLLIPVSVNCQNSTNYHSDSTFKNFSSNKVNVAKAQINLLKNGGALLVRLKTNANAITKLKAAGNIDLATQIERETFLTNKKIVRAYTQEFKFCPVFFFYSNFSDSVKKMRTNGIFLDTNLTINPTIVCNAPFYLIAEQGSVVNSSIGFISEEEALKTSEKGSEVKTVFAVIKSRYFFQLHKPFPYYQKGTGTKQKNYFDYVKSLNLKLNEFYSKNSSKTVIPESIKKFIY